MFASNVKKDVQILQYLKLCVFRKKFLGTLNKKKKILKESLNM